MKEIWMSNSDRPAIVGNVDFKKYGRLKWHLNGQGYVCRKFPGNRTDVRLHRLLMNVDKHQLVDHRNLNKLDNRRRNLRIANRTNNTFNKPGSPSRRRSRFKGIYRLSRGSLKWRAQVRAFGVRRHLGYFDSEKDAARAYDAAAIVMQGEFACTNKSMKLL